MQTKQTVVDWLAKELYTKMEMKGSGEVFDEIIKQANKIFQHQIINAFDEGQEYEYQYHINNAPKFYSETFFAETYGSKGSDDNHAYCGMIDCKCTTSSQTEISDEEIEEESWRYREVTKDMEIPPNEDWSNGAKWYREQLKSR